MRFPRVRRAALLAGFVPLAAAATLLAGSSAANASSASAYLSHTLPGPACGANSYKTIVTDEYANPLSWNSGWQPIGESGSPDGTVVAHVTENFYENGVTRFDEDARCAKHKTTYHQIPTKYVHRHLAQHWACGGGSCQILGTTTTDWSNGVTFS
jgi:hypothetical protein